MSQDEIPQVSIIMNCLDAERYLPAALDSVKAQTFQDYEIIFWDNGSKDASGEIAQSFDKRLRYFYTDETKPLGAARNLAIAEARGEYIAFLDCDDVWRPLKLEKQIELMQGDSALGLVTTDTEICRGSTLLYKLFTNSKPARGHVFKELMQRQWISMSSAMVRKEALDSVAEITQLDNGQPKPEWFDEELNVCEEADLFYRIAHEWEIDFVNEALTVWRIHSGNTTFEKFGQFGAETLHILEKHRKLYPDYDKVYPELIEELTSRAAFQNAIATWQKGEGGKARNLIFPYLKNSRKYKLFWWASFLPGSMFSTLAKFYFALPGWMRKKI